MKYTEPSSLPLNYLQPSPVRGQLDPLKDSTPGGSRYLQCTDTPNELRVQLPPATASYYARLLAAETSELNRGEQIVWVRLLEIRHLKERMIRKCHRLARDVALHKSPLTKTTSFRTLVAPADFRLKEMEKWFQRYQSGSLGKGLGRNPSKENITAKSFCCDRCAELSDPNPKQAQESSSKRKHSVSSPAEKPPSLPRSPRVKPLKPLATLSKGTRHSRDSLTSRNVIDREEHADIRSSSRQVDVRERQGRLTTAPSEINIRSPRISVTSNLTEFSATPNPPSTTHDTGKISSARSTSPADENLSPKPLPHLLRIRKAKQLPKGLTSPDGSTNSDNTTQISYENPPRDYSPTLTATPSPPDSSQNRRSILKYSNERSDGLPKTVSWAADRDWENQASNYTAAARDVQIAGDELEAATETRQTQIDTLGGLQKTVSQVLARLRLETENLAKVEGAIRAQQVMLQATTEQLGLKQSIYKAKGWEGITERFSTY